MLERIKVDSLTYNKILENYSEYIEYVENLSDYFTGYKDKHIIRTDARSRALIIQGYRLQCINDKLTGCVDDWNQVVCLKDESLDSEQFKNIPWATQANKKINDVLKKYYTEQEVDDLLKAHSVGNRRKPIHILAPDFCFDNKIHKFTNCTYYDINGAHTDALCEIFPKAADRLQKLHHVGYKDYINIFVGDLCNRGYRATYDWIVERTRTKLETIIGSITNNLSNGCGIVLYANTDGAIVWNASKTLKTSDLIGDIKSESIDGVVYVYVCQKDAQTSPYTIYQYEHPTKGIQLKGNARLALRDGMDLSKGIVNKAKIVKKDNRETFEHFRTEEIKIDEE